MTFALTALRCFFDLNKIQEKTTVSPFFVLIPFGNERAIGIPLRSSPTHSKYSSSPYFIHIFPPWRAMFLYALRFFFETGKTNASTYTIFSPPFFCFSLHIMRNLFL